jgi:hypothetical protein
MKHDPPGDRRPLIILTEDTINEAARRAMRILAEAKAPIWVSGNRLVRIVRSTTREVQTVIEMEPGSHSFESILDCKVEKRTVNVHYAVNVTLMDLKIMLDDHIRWRRGNRDTNSGRQVPARILAMRDEWPFPEVDEGEVWAA